MPIYSMILRALVFGLCLATVVHAQNYPNKPIHMLTGEAGGGSDLVARLLARGMSDRIGQTVVVENRGAASGAIAGEATAKAPADGYLLLFYSSSVWIVPLLRDSPYDPIRDFASIILVMSSPNILVVHPSVPVRTVKEFIVFVKAHPGQLNYASGGSGAPNHLAAELFKSMAGVNMVHVPYKGGGPGVLAVVSGQVELMFSSAAPVNSQIKAGKLRALGITTAQPSPLFPDLPTVAASGLPGYEAATLYGTFGPAKTPESIVKRLNQEIAAVMNQPEVKEKFLGIGVDAVGGAPDRLTIEMKADIARFGKVIKEANIKAD